MICYQDEKTYGAPINAMTPEKLELEIEQLEKQIYGRRITEKDYASLSDKSMIYDIEKGQLIENVR